jgi:hypothetical protein
MQNAVFGVLALAFLGLLAYYFARRARRPPKEGLTTTLKEKQVQGTKGLDGATEQIAESALGGKKQEGDVTELLNSYERYLLQALRHQVSTMAAKAGQDPSAIIGSGTAKDRDATKTYVEQLAAVRLVQDDNSGGRSGLPTNPLAKLTWY